MSTPTLWRRSSSLFILKSFSFSVEDVWSFWPGAHSTICRAEWFLIFSHHYLLWRGITGERSIAFLHVYKQSKSLWKSTGPVSKHSLLKEKHSQSCKKSFSKELVHNLVVIHPKICSQLPCRSCSMLMNATDSAGTLYCRTSSFALIRHGIAY